MIVKGPAALTHAELLAVLLGTGYGAQTALDLGRDLIIRMGGIASLSRAGYEDLRGMRGIGDAKALAIMACFELARRTETARNSFFKFQNAEQAARYLSPRLGNLDREHFYALYMDTHLQLVGEKLVAVGGQTQTVMDVRVLFQEALRFSAQAVLIAHNHPTGVLSPSESDKRITDKIREAGKVMEIRLVDHLIIGRNAQYYSFAETGAW